MPNETVCSIGDIQGHGRIRIICGDLTAADETYDVVICSAFKNDYTPTARSLIGALQYNRDISVWELSVRPELDLKGMGCWLSRPIDGDFRRVACLELFDRAARFGKEGLDVNDIALLKSAFITLRYMLEQADASGIVLRRIALPVLGSGEQRVDMEYLAAPLVTQCVSMFSTIPSLEAIDFYDRDPQRAAKLREICGHIFSAGESRTPPVFISYSIKQSELAHRLHAKLLESAVDSWIAPEYIPSGSCYLSEIPVAIAGSRVLTLLLTEDAQSSKWVQKEVSTAIGSGKTIVPVQLYPFSTNPRFSFLLDGEQIFPAWKFDEEEREARIMSEITAKLSGH